MHNAMSNQARSEHRQFQRKEHAEDKLQLKAVNDLLDERDKEIKAFAAKATEDQVARHHLGRHQDHSRWPGERRLGPAGPPAGDRAEDGSPLLRE
ncbi:hypothetical protein ABH853_22095 [Pseudomonas sp. 13.2]|uniref:Uncharacterized protein n=1 Tax=Pseudomonas sp. 13.2 TaxID=3144665 RepID=A0AAU7BF23_9PSED